MRNITGLDVPKPGFGTARHSLLSCAPLPHLVMGTRPFLQGYSDIHNLQHNQVWQVRRILCRESAMEMRGEDGRVEEGFAAVKGENQQVECRRRHRCSICGGIA